ncbi:MAG TPA: sensor histidine kinase [Streptosporangiaceae bacterium]
MTSDKPPLGQEVAQHAWRLSGRIVAGVGEALLWILTWIGRLLRPLATALTARLYGRSAQQGGPARPYHPGVGPIGAGQPGAGQPGAGQPGPQDGRTRVQPGARAHSDPLTGAHPQPPLPRWLNWWQEFARSWAFAPVTGAALTVAALAELALRNTPVVSLAGAFAVAATVPLVWRREFLRPVAAVVLSALAAALLSGEQPLATTVFAGLYALYLLAQQLPRQGAGALAVASAASVLVIHLASHGLDGIPWPVSMLAVIAAIGLGAARQVVETAERTNAEERERTTETLTRLNTVQREQAVLRERARIARELHDVVAHAVSMIAVQAETAPYTMRSLSPEAQRGYAEIARTAREALVEMRRLLTVLRADAKAEPEVAPQPRLDGLANLIEQHRGAGGRVDLSVHGSQHPLSATIELSAYRIVQEALTNARRHAPGAAVRVELTYLPDRLAVRVRDNGVSHPGSPHTEADPGHGLLGMRERATMLGGRFSAGPATSGGFLVEAELPLTSEETARQ